MNRILQTLQQDKKLLSIYCTAGYPSLHDTVPVLEALEASGVDLIEIGLPFSAPLADGPTIQASATRALQNGMTTSLLFEQLEGVRERVHLPLILMGYFNPVLQYGVEAFCKRCAEVGIDGLILPDLPVEVYVKEYQTLFEQYGLLNIFLITPQTTTERIRYMDKHTGGFLYMVSTASTTGKKGSFGSAQTDYFKRIDAMGLQHPQLVGFGIHDRQTFAQATQYAQGAIVGSAYIQFLAEQPVAKTKEFIEQFR